MKLSYLSEAVKKFLSPELPQYVEDRWASEGAGYFKNLLSSSLGKSIGALPKETFSTPATRAAFYRNVLGTGGGMVAGGTMGAMVGGYRGYRRNGVWGGVKGSIGGGIAGGVFGGAAGLGFGTFANVRAAKLLQSA